MKYSLVAATMALSVAAAPTAPAKFAIEITATMQGQTKTMYLGKDGKGTAVDNKADAASCSISGAENNLVCEGKVLGVKPPPVVNYVDMAALAPVSGSGALTDGFSVDENNVLHWKSKKFASLPTVGPTIMNEQKGEANWGLFKSALTGGQIQVYSQLGCPMKGDQPNQATHDGMIKHDPLFVGTNKVVPL